MERYRLRLVPHVSSVRCRSMKVSLPSFLVAAAGGARRLVIVFGIRSSCRTIRSSYGIVHAKCRGEC